MNVILSINKYIHIIFYKWFKFSSFYINEDCRTVAFMLLCMLICPSVGWRRLIRMKWELNVKYQSKWWIGKWKMLFTIKNKSRYKMWLIGDGFFLRVCWEGVVGELVMSRSVVVILRMSLNDNLSLNDLIVQTTRQLIQLD